METRTRADCDAAWRRDGERNGWRLPPAAPWPLQLAVLRHVRAMRHELRLQREARRLKESGVGLGRPTQRDLWVLYAIARGWC